MQCKDIPTLPILQFIQKWSDTIDFTGLRGVWTNWYFGDEKDVHLAMPEGLPDNLVLAKMNKLINNGLIDGCTCGCRGDYEITQKGRDYILTHTNNE